MSHAACYVLLLAKGRGVEEVLLETVACVERAGEAGGGNTKWKQLAMHLDRRQRQTTGDGEQRHSDRATQRESKINGIE